jgi:tyrosyl-tRNA synthetase
MVCRQISIAPSSAMPGSPLSELQRRHLIAQVSDRDGLDSHLNSTSRTIYAGFDPTADSLHIGNLVPLLALRRFQQYGHRPIVLVGGATGLIGDPSFKSGERALNARETVERWIERIRSQVSRFVDMTGNNAAVVVDNLDWTGNLDVISFLRDVGKHFSVNAMMQKESVRARLTQAESGISFTEFSYMLLQAMDFMELCKRFQCTVQLGGSDQWGNITAGMDLVRRSLGAECYALTVPLITKSDGTKFGKTESGSVWLDARRTSPYAFYQFWLNTADSDVLRFLGVFTFIELSELTQLGESVVLDPGKREAQRRLAREVTQLVHGDEGVRSAERISAALFGGRVDELTESDLEQLRQDGMPSTVMDEPEPQLVAVIATSGLATSRGAARKLIQGASIQVNGQVVSDCEAVLSREGALSGRFHLIRRGKKAWHLVVHA